MNAGELNKRVVIEIAQSTTDDVGQEVEAWIPLHTVWAKIETLRGQEQALAAGLAGSYDTRITIRWSPFIDAITAKWRIRYPVRGQNIVFDLKSVPPVPDDKGFLELTARSGLTEG